MKEKKPILGIIGGLGPMASAYFYERITEGTEATCDQEHIDIILSSRASTPDRTAFIKGESGESPLPYICEDIKKLEAFGASVAVITCNTTHCFIDEIRKCVNIPVPGIIEETAEYLSLSGCKKAGIMATDGTVATELYQKELLKKGVLFELPEKDYQKKVMEIIYGYVKKGAMPPKELFYEVVEHLKNKGCDRVILGCTELSVVNTHFGAKAELCDAMEVLAYKAICMCGGKPKGFPEDFSVIKYENL